MFSRRAKHLVTSSFFRVVISLLLFFLLLQLLPMLITIPQSCFTPESLIDTCIASKNQLWKRQRILYTVYHLYSFYKQCFGPHTFFRYHFYRQTALAPYIHKCNPESLIISHIEGLRTKTSKWWAGCRILWSLCVQYWIIFFYEWTTKLWVPTAPEQLSLRITITHCCGYL